MNRISFGETEAQYLNATGENYIMLKWLGTFWMKSQKTKGVSFINAGQNTTHNVHFLSDQRWI